MSLLHWLRLLLLTATAVPLASAAPAIWTGPTITFTKADNADATLEANQDRITTKVWLTRAGSQGIYNAKTEIAFNHFSSPADTEWADGTTANIGSMTFVDWNSWVQPAPPGPPSKVGTNAVLHLISEDIYIDIKFTAWSGGLGSGGGFSYQRSTPPFPNVPPTVAITSPTNGAAFTAPASITIEATADDTGGPVSNVEFFDGATALGSDTAAPFSLTVGLFPGTHLLSAVATDNQGATNTSATVAITISTVPINNPIVARIPKGDLTVELKTIADGMISPLGLAAPDDGSGRMFVYDQAGFIWLVTAAGRSPTPVLDIRSRLVNVSGTYDERGLLGLAVHTNFANQPLLYIYTSEFSAGPADFSTAPSNNHQAVITAWRLIAADSNVVDVASSNELLRIDEPQSNHNGGTLRFGPDGLLYISMGDGGQADDQGSGHNLITGNGQDLATVLGKVLRIDVDGTNSANGRYGIPADNPFVGLPGIDEIYAYGLRNPFNFSFDRTIGALYLADVGQNKVEEVDLIVKGANYGWNHKEGAFYFDPNGAGSGYVSAGPRGPVPPDLVDPIAQYDHDDGSAVIGGYVYRGTNLPALSGRYIFGDWGVFSSPAGRLFYLDATNGINELRIGYEDRPLGYYLKGFGEDATGELYAFVAKQGVGGNSGRMLKLIPAPPAAPDLTAITTLATNQFALNWSSSGRPSAVQRKTRLSEPIWRNDSITTNVSAAADASGANGFFRVLDTANLPAVPFSASLSGAGQRPPVSTAATGSALFSLQGNTLRFSVNYRGLSAVAVAAHIHGPAPAASNAAVLVDLGPYAMGTPGTNGAYTGVIVLTDLQKTHLLAGRTYVNVHTANNPSGEIRGQIAPVALHCALLPSNPTSAAGGSGLFALIGDQLRCNGTYGGLSGAATAAHIHGPAALGSDAGVLISLAPLNGSIAGTFTLTPDQLAAIVDGLTYVNVHTAANPGGEIRGQIWPNSTVVPLTTTLSGLYNRPTPLTNSASGSGTLTLDGDRLTFNLVYAGLSGAATAAHIHGPAKAVQTGGVLVDLEAYNGGAFGAAGVLSGSVVLTPTQRAALLAGQTYVNVHTDTNTAGEIRGQIAPVLMVAGMGSQNQVPPLTAPGSGSGLFALSGSNLTVNIGYRDLTGAATMAHIHGPGAANTNAPVLLDLAGFPDGAYGSAGGLSGTTALTPIILPSVIDQLTYVNFHTATNGAGEIRGQIVR